MKLIDRYILRQFLVPLCFCLLTFSMVFVVFDLFEHLSSFITAKTPIPAIIRYYLYVLPALAVYIGPISLLLGLLYALWQMTSHSELIAMRSGGISMMRIALPLLSVGLAASLTVSVIQEFIAPASSWWAAQFIERQERGEDLSSRFAFDLPYKNERAHRIWAIGRFDLMTHEMRDVKLIQQREDGSDYETIRAGEVRYYDGRWWFFKVMRQRYDLYNNPVAAVESEPLLEMRELTELPRDFANEVKDPLFLSALELLGFLKSHRNLSDKTQSRYMVDLHSRLAMPWTCLVVVLFGLPFGVHTARQSAFTGFIMALSTFFAYYLLMMVSQWMGKQMMMPPLLSAWLPNLAFLAIGLILMRRVR